MARVLILDDDTDLTEVMTLLLGEEGFSCLAVHSFAELKGKKTDALASDTAILDINLGAGQPSGLEAYRWLLGEGFKGRILFFTGHAKFHPLVQEAAALGIEVLEKPMDVGELVQFVGAIK